ncbi:arylsulfatase [Immundisolibacter sp.]|uniref:arylsulfatase n=1 Tax=Immundisolibacter sp. TaxID=1934948 RepID=UPI00356263E1
MTIGRIHKIGQLLVCLVAAGIYGGALAAARPNVLIIVADDMGYSDWGGFGGEIRTPNLDALADQGRRFTQFYTAATCSPTRAMLLTGIDHHLVGLSTMEELLQPNQRGVPGYEGYLNRRAVTLPELLHDGGYTTLVSGKWHLGMGLEQDPSRFGFDRSFVMLRGAASHFGDQAPYAIDYAPIYRENGHPVQIPASFYSSDAYASKLIEWIEAKQDDTPLFAYLAFTAPHDPLHVPDEWLDKYAGRYDGGYDKLREQRLARARELGVVAQSVRASPRPPHVPAWDDLSQDEQRASARSMEIYAAMVENLDANVGRVLAAFKRKGIYDNTLIIFFSDNGANGITLQQNPLSAPGWVARNSDNRLQNLGKKGSRPSTGPGWAVASSSPFRLFKVFISEGGIRSPLIVAGPGVGKASPPDDAVLTVRDLMPTVLESAGLVAPDTYQKRAVLEVEGRSMWPLLKGEAPLVHPADESIGFELFGMRALRRGDWKITWISEPFAPPRWQLFNIADDPAETRDLAVEQPERLDALRREWDRYAAQVGVVLPDNSFFKGRK